MRESFAGHCFFVERTPYLLFCNMHLSFSCDVSGCALRSLRRVLLGTIVLALLSSCGVRSSHTSLRSEAPKHEMRAVWWPTVWRTDYAQLGRAEREQLVEKRLDRLQSCGVNAVVFQVRSECDAMYVSPYEPYSRFYSGEQGKAPKGGGDMLAHMIAECHKRGMQLHAWINPYRAATNAESPRAASHIAEQRPDWIVRYDKSLYLNPALEEVRRYVCRVATDLVMNYDIDALHIDDYFYPYPVAGKPFPDDREYDCYVRQNRHPLSRDDWRRENVNLMVRDLKQTLLQTKPWVPLGISPFGIYRNVKSDSRGSATTGLEGYDALYADVLWWVRQGWIDYIAPQIYWNQGFAPADYDVLTDWWRRSTPRSVLLYIGQDVKRTQDAQQLDHKMRLSRTHSEGNIFWPGEEVWNDYRSIAGELSEKAYVYKSLVPTLEKGKARGVSKLQIRQMGQNYWLLEWNAFTDTIDPMAARFFVVYMAEGHKPNIRSGRDILSVSSLPSLQLALNHYRGSRLYFAVTAVDRMGRESKPQHISYFVK